MTVTELALIQLGPNLSIQDPSLRRDLTTAKNAMESFTGNNFYYYSKVDDPSSMYIIGAWSSTEQHWDHWIPSEENQNLLSLLKDKISVDWMFHIDLKQTRIPMDAPVLVVERYSVAASEKAQFPAETIYPANLPYQPVGGWRIEKEDEEKEEFVLFSGFDSTEEHKRVATLSSSETLRRIRETSDSSVGYWNRLQL